MRARAWKVAALAALTTQIAAASPSPDVSGYLAPAPASDWIESGPGTNSLIGVITPQSYAAWVADNSTEEGLRRDGFVTGYGRAWEQKVSQDDLSEFVMAFNSATGATRFYNDLKLFDQTSKYYTRDITTIEAEQSVGVEWTYSDGSREFAIEFAKGNLFFDVTMDADSNDLAATTLAQAQSEFDVVPQSGDIALMSNTTVQPAGWVIGVSLSVFVVLLAAGLYALVISARRRTVAPGYSAGAQMSPDRAYWWDGSRWRNANLEPPPGAQRSSDGLYWWDGQSWRRSGPG